MTPREELAALAQTLDVALDALEERGQATDPRERAAVRASLAWCADPRDATAIALIAALVACSGVAADAQVAACWFVLRLAINLAGRYHVSADDYLPLVRSHVTAFQRTALGEEGR